MRNTWLVEEKAEKEENVDKNKWEKEKTSITI